MDKRKIKKLEQILRNKTKKNYLLVVVNINENELLLKSIYECDSRQYINIVKNEMFNNIDEVFRKYNINPERDKILNMFANKFIWGND